MIIELIIALIMGILFGCITGLIPGIHINLVAIMILGVSASLLTVVSPLTLVIFIVAMAITHTFLDYIPSVFLGAPDEDSFLAVLPGHKLLQKGHAYSAVVFTLYGSLFSLIVILVFAPLFIFLLPIIYPYIQRIMWIILVVVSLFLLYTEKEKKLHATIVFLLAGFLGIASLNLNLKEPLLPLLTGLFGASSILISIFQKTNIPKQKILPLKKIRLSKKSFSRASLASVLASPFTAFLPGLGASQAALIGTELIQDKEELDPKEFLFLLGAINTIVMGLSFITLYSIQKTRTGAAVAVSRLIPELSIPNLSLIILAIFISGIISFFIAILTSKIAARNINKIKYELLSIIILIVLTIIVFIFSGPFSFLSLLVFITSTALGMFTIQIKVRRMHLMGCLLIPTILFYLL